MKARELAKQWINGDATCALAIASMFLNEYARSTGVECTREGLESLAGELEDVEALCKRLAEDGPRLARELADGLRRAYQMRQGNTVVPS